MTDVQSKTLTSVLNLLEGVLAIADKSNDEYSDVIKEITRTACNRLYDIQKEL